MTVFTEVLSASKAGLSLVPPRRDGTKAPISAWRQYQSEPPTLAQVEQWYVHEGHTGLGLVCGAVSNGLEMLEIEGSARAEGMHNQFVDRCKQAGVGELVERIVLGYAESTPTGGFHFLYRCNEIEGNQKLARRSIEGVVQVLIETRGEGGYVVVAPTPGEYHPSGRPWEMKHGGFGTIVTITPDEREALLDVARSFDEMPKREQAIPASARIAQDGDRPGDWYNANHSWHEILEPHGWLFMYEKNDISYWRRPGKNVGISASTNYADSDLFWVFSTSTSFDSEISYTKFGTWCHLEHDNDFTIAAAVARSMAPVESVGPKPGSSAEAFDELIGPTLAYSNSPSGAATTSSAVGPGVEYRITLMPASEIRMRPVRWTWDRWVALGTLCLIGGREGIGKSLAGYTLAADLTRGRMKGVFEGQPKSVIVAATEDSWEHTIVPRLVAANADLTRVFRVDVHTPEGGLTTLVMPRDLGDLERLIGEVDAAMVLLDPLISRLDRRLDTHKDSEVRVALEPLVMLADRANCTIFGLIHVNKSVSLDPLTVLMGSRAFSAVARSVLFVARDPEDKDTRILGHAKNNLGPTQTCLTFEISGQKVADTDEGPVWTAKLTWTGEDERAIEDIVRTSGGSPADNTKIARASEWLLAYLKEHRAVAKKVLVAEAAEFDWNPKVLNKARENLRIGTSPLKGSEKFWTHPSISPEEAEQMRLRGAVVTTVRAQPTDPGDLIQPEQGGML